MSERDGHSTEALYVFWEPKRGGGAPNSLRTRRRRCMRSPFKTCWKGEEFFHFASWTRDQSAQEMVLNPNRNCRAAILYQSLCLFLHFPKQRDLKWSVSKQGLMCIRSKLNMGTPSLCVLERHRPIPSSYQLLAFSAEAHCHLGWTFWFGRSPIHGLGFRSVATAPI